MKAEATGTQECGTLHGTRGIDRANRTAAVVGTLILTMAGFQEEGAGLRPTLQALHDCKNVRGGWDVSTHPAERHKPPPWGFYFADV